MARSTPRSLPRAFRTRGDFGNAFIKISTAGGLSVADYFATFDTVSASNADTDLGSGGAMVFPDFADGTGATRHLAVGAGKDGHIYVVDRDGRRVSSEAIMTLRRVAKVPLVPNISAAMPCGPWLRR